MARTAYDEEMGLSREAISIVGTYRMGLPNGPGGCRAYALGFTDPHELAVLPDARHLRLGGPQITVFNVGSQEFELADKDGTTLVTVAPGECVEAILLANATAAGEWLLPVTTFEAGTPIPVGRAVYRWRVDANQSDFNVRDGVDVQGYDGVTPCFVHVTIGPYVLSASTTSMWGFDTGTFPAGSTLFVVFEPGAYITGKGGAGGRGGDVGIGLLAADGLAGGAGMRVRVTTVLSNHGDIQGGGGGGGGGAANSAAPLQQAGGGGGGGAGLSMSFGGQPGSGGGAQGGDTGMLSVPGNGGTGYVPGGRGGHPGSAGSNGSAVGGAAGDAIQVSSGVTLTKLVAGSIAGAETVV